MNIHEHQAKEILKEFGDPVSEGIVILSLDEIKKKITNRRSKAIGIHFLKESQVYDFPRSLKKKSQICGQIITNWRKIRLQK